MPILAGMGRFFLHFGLACFILSAMYLVVFNAYGLPVHPTLAKMSTLFAIAGFTTALTSVLAIVGKVFVPGTVAQAAAYAAYLSIFMSAVSGIASVVGTLASLLPLPGGVNTALVAIISSLASGSMLYYIGTRVSTLPPE